MKKIILLLIFFISVDVKADYIGFKKINSKTVKSWSVKSISDYQGLYHFGDSELESELRLIIVKNSVYAQIKYGKWNKDNTKWIFVYKNLSSVKIINNKFYSDQTNGEFVICNCYLNNSYHL